MRLAVLAVLCCSAGVALADPPGMTPPGGAPPRLTVAPDSGIPGVTPPGLAPLQEPAQPRPAPGHEGYRLQTLAADGAAALFVVAAVASSNSNGDGDRYGQLALGTYLLGAPIVHAVHGHASRALASLALRVGLPLAGAYVGSALASHGNKCTDYCDEDSDDELGGVILGGLAGMLAAVAIDTGVLARGDEVAAPARTIAPAIAPTQGGMSFGVSGAW